MLLYAATMWDTALRYLYEAAQHGSMRLASEKIGVAVSSISRQIAQLEDIFGVPLIEHGRRTIKLTQAGHIALAFYRERVAKQDSLLDEFRALRDMKAGRVEIALGEGFLSEALAEFLDTFQAQHPLVDLSVIVGSTAEVISRVAEDEAHLGLVIQSAESPKIRIRTSVLQPLQVICAPHHPLAGRTSLILRDLIEHNLCLTPNGYRIRNLISDVEARNRVWLQTAFTTNSMYLTRKMLLTGRSISILPAIVVVKELMEGSLVTVPLDEPELDDTNLSVICRLGRRLNGAPLHLVTALEAQLRLWSGTSEGGDAARDEA